VNQAREATEGRLMTLLVVQEETATTILREGTCCARGIRTLDRAVIP